MHKLRILLRNESVMWTDAFIIKGGMDEVVALLYRIIAVEWREEHEDNLLHETLLCLKALCTTSLALRRLTQVRDRLFQALLGMVFDEERKGPSEYSTRGVIVSLLFAHLSEALHGGASDTEIVEGECPKDRAKVILGYLRDPTPEGEKAPLGFIAEMHVSRPWKVWGKEVVNVTKEVFWIFLHHGNVITLPEDTDNRVAADEEIETDYAKKHFPRPRPPHPAAPYTGGVEWEATQYLALHLDLLNGLIACAGSREERNELRKELRESGWEKWMGGTVRTCKEKFYGAVHEGLRCWVRAADTDGWEVKEVREGVQRELKSPAKKVTGRGAAAPKLDVNVGSGGSGSLDEEWL